VTDFATWPRDEIPQRLVAEMKANDGLAPVDLDRFWADQEVARKDPFGESIPQCPLGIGMSWECVFAELGVDEDVWRYQHDTEWALGLNKAYNDIAERVVGRRLLNETPQDPSRHYPAVKGLHDVFEAKNEWHAGSWWLRQSAHNEEELAALLDRVEERLAEGLRDFLLPENWDEEKARLTGLGVRPPLYRGQRGPVTFAMSVYGVENLIFLLADNPGLAARFRDLILAAMLEIGRVRDDAAGYTPETAPRGFSFCDDNCALLTPDLYERFGYPILKGMFDRYSPDPGDTRYQHSDSAMAHILPVLGRLNLTGTNFGPTVTVSEIREHLPNAVIHGQLAPFTFSRNEEEKIVAEFLRDFGQTREERGLVFTTAGSINNGSRLTGMRLIMSAIQHFGRYHQE
jgi:uroporphyrinogen decarboxylase